MFTRRGSAHPQHTSAKPQYTVASHALARNKSIGEGPCAQPDALRKSIQPKGCSCPGQLVVRPWTLAATKAATRGDSCGELLQARRAAAAAARGHSTLPATTRAAHRLSSLTACHSRRLCRRCCCCSLLSSTPYQTPTTRQACVLASGQSSKMQLVCSGRNDALHKLHSGRSADDACTATLCFFLFFDLLRNC